MPLAWASHKISLLVMTRLSTFTVGAELCPQWRHSQHQFGQTSLLKKGHTLLCVNFLTPREEVVSPFLALIHPHNTFFTLHLHYSFSFVYVSAPFPYKTELKSLRRGFIPFIKEKMSPLWFKSDSSTWAIDFTTTNLF